MTDSERRLAWTATLFALAAIGGIALQARGALFVTFQGKFGVTESLLGLVTPVGAIGFVTMVVIVGSLAGRIRIRGWMFAGVLGTAVCFVAIGLAPSFLWLLGFIGIRMAATGTYRALDRPILAHLYPAQRGRIFNLQTMAWASGASVGPLLVTAILLVGEWYFVYFVLALLMVPILVALWRLDSPTSLGNERSFTRIDFRRIVTRRELLVMTVALILVGGIESVFFTWLPFYASQFFRPEIGNLTLSLYLAAYIPGRYLYSRLTPRFPYLLLTLGTGVVTTLMLPVTFSLAGQLAFFPSVFALGLLISGLFPTLLAWGIDTTPEFTGPINATALTAAQVGFFVFPASVGFFADVVSIQSAMFIQVALAVVLVAVVVVGHWYVGEEPGELS